MQLHSSLILLIALFFIFTPTLEVWLLNGSTHWYRPYLIWIAVILIAYMGQRNLDNDEL